MNHPLTTPGPLARLVGLRSISGVLAVVGLAVGLITTIGSEPSSAAACAQSGQQVTVPARVLGKVTAQLTSGDREFFGHGPAITVAATRQLISNTAADYFQVKVYMKAEETEGDWSVGSATENVLLWTAPPGCHVKIGSASLESFDSNGYLARTSYANPFPLSAGDTDINKSFVSGYTVYDDRVGDDIGVYTGVTVSTRAFTVTLT